MSVESICFLINLGSTLFMTGLIWLVQCLHYPLFKMVGPEHRVPYLKRHVIQITPIVAIPMLAEAFSGLLLLYIRPDFISFREAAMGFALIFFIWLVTALGSVPCHDKLQKAWSDKVHKRLVRSNWLRTLAWSARSVLVLWLVAKLLS